jgi:transcriptional regulator with XRE-family HTH domain
MLGLSQEALANRLGITFQQVQKYERGANRMGSSRLYDIGVALDVPVSFFFDDMPEGVADLSPRSIIKGSTADAVELPGDESFSRRETFDLVRAYYAIVDPSIRKRVYDLAKSLAQMDD